MVKILLLECLPLIHLQRLVCICKMDTHIDYQSPITHMAADLFKSTTLKLVVLTASVQCSDVLACVNVC